MKIGLSLVNFNPGKMGGVEVYFRNLLEHLQRVDPVNQYSLLCDERSAGHFRLHAENFDERLIRWRHPRPLRWIRSLLRHACGVDLLTSRIDALGLDMVHHPFSMMSLKPGQTPIVVTIHDIQYEYFPDFFGEAECRRRREGVLAAISAARVVLTISEFTRRSLVERYGVPAEKIVVAYMGCDRDFRRIEDQAALSALRQKYGIDRPFIYFPAASWPHKNHTGLLRALRLLIDRYQFEGGLVLTGIARNGQEDIERLVVELGLQGRVRMLGYLERDELPVLYSLARMLVYPSFFEGFGIPLLEAMACGCPIACSNVTSLPEVAGDAALMFDPGSTEDMARAIWDVWSDEGVRSSLLSAAKEREKLFDLDAFARVTAAAYSAAAEPSRLTPLDPL
ncbi:glycosyltransferase, MtfB-like family [Citrifermentans bemidjiense Bem]|uniref:Glycosyltransferase, MtfB-like family n=1 Tax=Citrifermentans bemidjiense (strain ATCC BAA-1014 / DSM 16622 / JCM 12645 / Bem) TaxID=404380 RepID=B5EEY0_CITBB|nr:glycosyltransferase family 1 protein [Citrifermentans bemidjiense]ACH37876.1 glycosyltransferase, MtfB-like family [Citrifermentans bemidjiense Bem]